MLCFRLSPLLVSCKVPFDKAVTASTWPFSIDYTPRAVMTQYEDVLAVVADHWSGQP